MRVIERLYIPKRFHPKCLVVLVALASWALMTPAADSAGITKSTMVARVDSDTITVYDLVFSAWNNRLLGSTPYRAPEKLRPLLENLIYETMLAAEASSFNLSDDWVYRTRDRVVTTLAASQLFQDERFLQNVVIDSADIDSYYQAHIDLYTVPRPQRHVRQITVYKEGMGVPEGYLLPIDTLYVGWDRKRKIDSLYQRLRDGEDFGDLAAIYSEEPRARTTFGDWGWVSREGIGDTVLARLMFDQPLYYISKPVAFPFGWVIIQILGEREAGTREFNDEVAMNIRQRLIREKGTNEAAAMVDSLLRAARVTIFDDNLARPDTNIALSTPLAVLNDRDTVYGADYFHIKNNDSDLRPRAVLSLDERRGIVRNLLKSLALRSALRTWGYLDRPEVREASAKERIIRVKDRLKAQLSEHLAPDSAQVRRYYKEHIREFTPDRRHFIFSRVYENEDSAAATVARWRAGEPPQNVHSQWIQAGDVPNPVWNRIASVTAGSIIGPIAVKGEYWIVVLDRIAEPKPLRQVFGIIRGRIRDEKLEQRREEWVRRASQRHTVVRRLSVLNDLVLPTREEANTEWFEDVIQSKAATPPTRVGR
jgi:hypothetical protein